MKRILSFLCVSALLGAFVFSSCQPTEAGIEPSGTDQGQEEPIDNGGENGGVVDRPYLLYLSFVDTDGNDLVKDIGAVESGAAYEIGHVLPDEYTLISFPNKRDLGWLSDPTAIYDNPNPYPDLALGHPIINDMLGVEREVLEIRISSAPWYEGYVDEITYTLTCPHIFGDEAAHEIVTYWRDPSDTPTHYRFCYRVVVDGVEYTDIEYAGGQQVSYATITLDR
ncbi:MAG: hypothetical protein LBU97_05605 [Alistipes sp.]|jgi:hypothetical protein|nr:hypothetical protein [Alistipes sp.]